MPRKLAILIFDDVEVLDFCGPFEVFAVTRDPQTDQEQFQVYLVAENHRPVVARNGLTVLPRYTILDAPTADIILVPGGRGTRTAMNNPNLIEWIQKQGQNAELVLSVCTGALMLAKAGFLQGLSATTYHTAFEELQAADPTVTLCRGERYVDNGKVITSAGISAGIDMSLYVVERLHGVEQARWTANHMEYEYYFVNQKS
ncbi:MAG: DJ-1/PfpI family protein [Anaerolineae bacterium]|jgi:transcriptional regulator GlxA family with amidase domain|nr:DJ-1/PfpI family protein [Anaerolineae bacterium]